MASTEQEPDWLTTNDRVEPAVEIEELEVIVDPEDGTASVWTEDDEYLADEREQTLGWIHLDTDYLFYLEEWR